MTEIAKFKRFNLISNSKNPTNEWSKKNRKKSFRRGEFKNNSGVPTGKVNNITVVDLDFHKFDTSHINEFEKEFKNFVCDFNTYTVQTANDGYHLYFEYDEEIKQTVNNTYHIDIRSDGGYVVSPGSMIDGKSYKVVNDTTVKPIPVGLRQWLLKNLYTIDTQIKSSNKRVRKAREITPVVHKYNFTRSELKTLIENLPEKYWSIENYNFLKFTSFCKFFDIQDIWDEVNQTKPGYNHENNINCYWNYATCNENIIDEILSEEYINYGKYKPIPVNVIQPDVKIDTGDEKKYPKHKLGYQFFEPNINYLVKSDTGTGKTTSFKHYVKDSKKKFISIVSRISLADEQYRVFSEHNITCKHYNIADHLHNGDNIIITIDSIGRMYDVDFSDYVIFLDEYNSLLKYLVTSDTLASRRSIVYSLFKRIVHNASQIICADADLNDISIKWMRQHRQNITYIQNSYLHNRNIGAYEIKSFNDLLVKLRTETKFLLCTDSKSNAELIYKELKDDSICLITGGKEDSRKGDSKKETLDLDAHKKVIFSPKIMYGVDSTMKRNVYCYYKEHTIEPTGYLQQVARCRNIDELFYLFGKKKFAFSSKTYDDICMETYKQNMLGIRYFKEEVNPEVFNEYQNLLNKYLYIQDCYSTNKFAHFRHLLTQRGFVIDTNEKFLKMKETEMRVMKKELKQQKFEQFNIAEYPRLHNILQVPTDQLNTYAEYYIDDFARMKHFNLCSMLNTTNEDLKSIITLEEDFNVNKITTGKSKVMFVQKLKSYMNTNTDFKTMTVNKDISEADRETLFEQYNIIFRNQSKKKTFDTNKHIEQYLAKMYKVLFGNDIIDIKTTRQRINGKRIAVKEYTINEDCYNKHHMLYQFRQSRMDVSKRLF